MFSFSDPFGIKRRRREKLERMIAPYVRPGDDELTKAALRLAFTEKNFGRGGLGYFILERELKQESDVIFDLLLKLKERGLESAARECEYYDIPGSQYETQEDQNAAYEEILAALEGRNKN